MPIPMPAAPPYAPLPTPPWIDEQPPPPPTPPAPPSSQPPSRPRRGRAAAVLVALALLCGGIGLELGGALFSPSSTRTSTATATATPGTATLPTVGTTPPATGGSTTGLTTAEIAAKVDPSIVNITTMLSNGTAAGTGMVLTSSGLVLTNNHVIADATEIRVQVNGNGPTYTATVLGYDISNDVALLQLDGASNLQPITVGDSSKVALRDRVVALGNALGRGGTPAIAQGVVTGLDQTIVAGDPNGPSQSLSGLIEISAPLVPGDSGGPLVNAEGEVIGMNAAASQQNGRGTGDAFAIPIATALDIANQIKAGQSSASVHIGARALLGVHVQQGQGPTVAGVQPGSPADAAGLVAGDVIVSVGDASISMISDLTAALDRYHPGDKVTIGWSDASGRHHSATVQLIEGPPA